MNAVYVRELREAFSVPGRFTLHTGVLSGLRHVWVRLHMGETGGNNLVAHGENMGNACLSIGAGSGKIMAAVGARRRERKKNEMRCRGKGELTSSARMRTRYSGEKQRGDGYSVLEAFRLDHESITHPLQKLLSLFVTSHHPIGCQILHLECDGS